MNKLIKYNFLRMGINLSILKLNCELFVSFILLSMYYKDYKILREIVV